MKQVLVIVILFAGCSVFPELQQPDILPQLVVRTPLPTVPPEWSRTQPKLEVLFHIARTGEVMDARILTPTGYDAWESKAVKEMVQWRFSPARVGADSVPVWIRVPMSLRFVEPRTIFLAELVYSDRTSADSAYLLLLTGREFEWVARELLAGGKGAFQKNIGETDIRIFSEQIQGELIKLKENEFTKPIRLGDSYVIFKRLSKTSGTAAGKPERDFS